MQLLVTHLLFLPNQPRTCSRHGELACPSWALSVARQPRGRQDHRHATSLSDSDTAPKSARSASAIVARAPMARRSSPLSHLSLSLSLRFLSPPSLPSALSLCCPCVCLSVRVRQCRRPPNGRHRAPSRRRPSSLARRRLRSPAGTRGHRRPPPSLRAGGS